MKRRSKQNPSGNRSDAQPVALARPPLSARKKWAFRLMALALPLLLLLAVELGLRLGGYGYDPAFFRVERDAAGKAVLLNNDRFTLRFFPSELARWPGTFRLAAEKPAGVRRIFIFGESAAMGDPQPSLGASRHLEVLLRERFPGEKFEIVNLGITAINSHVILPIAQEVAARGQGDIWLLYIGNNEMVGPFGAATVFGSQAPPLTAVRANLAIQQTRLGQLAVSALRQFGAKPPNASWGGMKMFLQNQIPPEDPRRETVYRNFAGNLRDIIAAGQSGGAKIILSTMAVNLRDCPPFASMVNSNLSASDQLQCHAALEAGTRFQEQGQFDRAAAQFAAAAQLDPQFAVTQFRWAQCLLAQSNAVAAREHFQRACDVDALPFRADTRINGTIRELSQELEGSGVVFCDAEATFAALAPAGGAGDEAFFEHVHFNFDGNYQLGKLWAIQVEQSLPEAVRRTATPAWASQEVCERAIGLSEWNRGFVLAAVLGRMAQPPLNNQFNNPQRAAGLQEALRRCQEAQRRTNQVALTRADFNAAVARSPQDAFLRENYANFLEAIGNNPAALAEYRAITELLPHDFYGCLQTGRMLGEAGQRVAARDYLKRAAQHRPSLPEPWYELGIVAATEEQFAEALDYFERAVRLRPQDGGYLAYQAKTLSKLGRKTEAIAIYREAIKSPRGGWEAHFELAGELAGQGAVAESIREYGEVLRLNPRHAVSHVNLGVMLVRQNQLEEAIRHFELALQLNPNYPEALNYLTQVRARKMKQP